jgi:hypothetical protein
MLNFHAVRNWMSQTYGFASTLANDIIDNEHWSFHMEYQVYMIYLRGDEDCLLGLRQNTAKRPNEKKSPNNIWM